MPELSRSLGLVMRMQFADHPPPHFHVFKGKKKPCLKEHQVTNKIDDFTISSTSKSLTVSPAAYVRLRWRHWILHPVRSFRAWRLIETIDGRKTQIVIPPGEYVTFHSDGTGMVGRLLRPQLLAVLGWTVIHQADLLAAWDAAYAGLSPRRISPL